MSLISILTSAFNWLKKGFVSHIVDADKVAVTITEMVKTLLANPVTNFLENVADSVTGTQVPTNIANDINAVIPKILSVELAIEGLPDNATPQQILAFEQSVLKAFSVNANNSKLYTELGAQIYGIIQTTEATGNANFAGWVTAIETTYTDYQKDLTVNATVVSNTSVVPGPIQFQTPIPGTTSDVLLAQPGATNDIPATDG